MEDLHLRDGVEPSFPDLSSDIENAWGNGRDSVTVLSRLLFVIGLVTNLARLDHGIEEEGVEGEHGIASDRKNHTEKDFLCSCEST